MKDINELIEDYIINTKLHDKFINECNHKKANKSFEKIIESLLQIKAQGEQGRIALLKLIEHEDDNVRVAAATHSLRINKEKAESILREISKKSGTTGLRALMVLKEWDKGTLEIPS